MNAFFSDGTRSTLTRTSGRRYLHFDCFEAVVNLNCIDIPLYFRQFICKVVVFSRRFLLFWAIKAFMNIHISLKPILLLSWGWHFHRFQEYFSSQNSNMDWSCSYLIGVRVWSIMETSKFNKVLPHTKPIFNLSYQFGYFLIVFLLYWRAFVTHLTLE